MSTSDWQSLFVGRVDDVGALVEKWHLAEAGHPEFVVLLGPTGIGKTRIVQEFYRELSKLADEGTAEAPEGYWPDAFHTDLTRGHVNPAFDVHDDRPRPPIPFLWWGLRFEQPGGDKPIAQDVALLTSIQRLKPHLFPVLAKRRIEQVRRGWLWRVLEIGQSFTETAFNYTTLGIPAALKAGWDTWQEARANEEAAREADESVGRIVQRGEDDVVSLAMEAFRHTLDPGITDAPTVPAVVLVDDAQWADRTTLQFLHDLWAEASARKWPLLVVATHWDHEWEQNRVLPVPDHGRPERLADFLGIFGLPDEPGISRRIDKLGDELDELVRGALPGLPADQRELLLDKADGNPRLLEQILKLLEKKRKFFVGKDPSGPLADWAVERITAREYGLHAVVRERFEDLAENVQSALGWSSVQGRRFLADMTVAVADEVGGTASEEVLDGLRVGESPECLVEFDRTHGRFNLGMFRHAAFHEVAAAVLQEDPEELAAVERAVTETLRGWLDGGRVAELPNEERRDVLGMAKVRLRPTDSSPPEEWTRWGRALVQLVELDRSDYLWDRAEETAIAFADARADGWPLELVDTWSQVAIVDCLRDMREYDRAVSIAAPLAERLERLTVDATEERLLKDTAAVLQRAGDAELGRGDRQAAADCYRRCVAATEQRRDRFDGSPESLRDVSVSLNKVGDVLRAEGEWAEALTLYREGLGIRREIVDRFGGSPVSLRDVSISLERVGDVLLAEGDRAEALTLYREGLGIAREIVDRFGGSPQSLRDVSISCERMGDTLAESDPDAARSHYTESLRTWGEIRDRFGVTPDTFRGPCVPRQRLAVFALQAGHVPAARALFETVRDDLRTTVERGWAPAGDEDWLARVENLLTTLDDETSGEPSPGDEPT